ELVEAAARIERMPLAILVDDEGAVALAADGRRGEEIAAERALHHRGITLEVGAAPRANELQIVPEDARAERAFARGDGVERLRAGRSRLTYLLSQDGAVSELAQEPGPDLVQHVDDGVKPTGVKAADRIDVMKRGVAKKKVETLAVVIDHVLEGAHPRREQSV